jgi:ATP-dependent DNA ligase
VVLGGQGRPSLQLIQNSATGEAPVVSFAFAILRLAGREVRSLPLRQRQQLLRDSLRTSDLVQVSESFSVPAPQMIAVARERFVTASRRELYSRLEPLIGVWG